MSDTISSKPPLHQHWYTTEAIKSTSTSSLGTNEFAQAIYAKRIHLTVVISVRLLLPSILQTDAADKNPVISYYLGQVGP